jgi:hypothetical protein
MAYSVVTLRHNRMKYTTTLEWLIIDEDKIMVWLSWILTGEGRYGDGRHRQV